MVMVFEDGGDGVEVGVGDTGDNDNVPGYGCGEGDGGIGNEDGATSSGVSG